MSTTVHENSIKPEALKYIPKTAPDKLTNRLVQLCFSLYILSQIAHPIVHIFSPLAKEIINNNKTEIQTLNHIENLNTNLRLQDDNNLSICNEYKTKPKDSIYFSKLAAIKQARDSYDIQLVSTNLENSFVYPKGLYSYVRDNMARPNSSLMQHGIDDCSYITILNEKSLANEDHQMMFKINMKKSILTKCDDLLALI